MQPIKRFENFELVIGVADAAAGKIKFGDIPTLRSDPEKDCLIKAIKVYAGDFIPVSYTNNPSATVAQMQGMFMTIYYGGDFAINNVPILDMVTTYQKGSATPAFWSNRPFEVDNLQIDWPKTILTFQPFVIAAQISIMFGIANKYITAGTMNAIRARQALAESQGINIS